VLTEPDEVPAGILSRDTGYGGQHGSGLYQYRVF
jgi:hypothetical protein